MVIAAKLDRLFRSELDALEIHAQFIKRGIGLHLIDLGDDIAMAKVELGEREIALGGLEPGLGLLDGWRLRGEPRENRDLMVMAANSWTVALDNLSYLQQWLSDALCCLSTGGGFSRSGSEISHSRRIPSDEVNSAWSPSIASRMSRS